ncbi:MAG: WbqC family protein [Chitinophagales bacterium]|nr:WbqC family protein [Chitinophagales bacterium]
MSQSILIEPHYWGSITYFQQLFSAESIVFDIHSHFKKGTYRNRCQIMGPNGKLSLSVPLIKGKDQHSVFKDVSISYAENWKKDHWQSLLSSYRRSSYFEYYEDEIAPLYQENFDKLSQLNMASIHLVMRLLKKDLKISFTENYITPGDFEGLDLRNTIHPNINKMSVTPMTKPYVQVFMDRMDFLSDLSILDLLFNLGPRALEYLEQ